MSTLMIFLIIFIGYVIPIIGDMWLYWSNGHLTEVWLVEDSKPDWKCFTPVINAWVFVVLLVAFLADYAHPPVWSGLYQKRHHKN
jgi:hypothetical protein